jgi:hypothetical protein
MPDEVILDVTTIEENVTVETTAGDVVEIQVLAPTGTSATVAVGTTTTGAAGTNASVTNSGTTSAAVFNFTIPRGDTGAAGASGGSSTAWRYKAKTNATSGYPTDGHLLWNNATQTSATAILVSHKDDEGSDVELFLSFFLEGQKIFIQNRNDSSQNQIWEISGTPTVTGANTSTAYYTFPVTLVSSAGSPFTNGHSILFGTITQATNSVTSATTSDYTAELNLAQVNTGVLVVTDGVTIETLDYNFGTGAAQALKDALEIASTDITDFTTAVQAIAPDAVTSATTSDGTANLAILTATVGSALVVGDGDSIKGRYDIFANTSHFQWYSDSVLYGEREFLITTENLTSSGAWVYKYPAASGTFAVTASTTGVPDKLTDGTIAGTLTLNTTSYTYGTGAAAAHRTALGLDTLFNDKANLVGGNTFTGAQSINGTVTTSDKVSIDSVNAVTNPKLLITASTASGTDDNSPLVIKGSGINRTASINLRTTGGSGELYGGWLAGRSGGGIHLNSSLLVSNGASGPLTGTVTFAVLSNGNVGVGVAAPNAAAKLQIDSTTQGFLPPRMTTTNRNAIASVPAGLMIYNTSTNKLNFYNGTAWEAVTSA